MPSLDEDRRAIADDVWRRLAIVNELTPPQARLFVRSLQTSWHVPTIAWGERESIEQFEDAQRLIHAADIYSALEGPEAPRVIECYRRAAEILEWLSRSADGLHTVAPVALYAAGAFQLGGMPAMASSLLRQPEILKGEEKLYAEFLRGDFDGTVEASAEFWSHHLELTGRDGSVPLLAGDSDDRIAWYVVVELVRCLGLIADTLRRGDTPRLHRARTKLSSLEHYILRSAGPDAWMLVSLLRAAADRFATASIYSQLERLADSADHGERLRRFAREQFARGRGILWTSQIQGLERLARDGSFALCTPTGSGKTLIATLALVKELLLAPDGPKAPLGLYLVPSRALAGEVETKLEAELRSAGDFVVTGLYGGTEWGITDYWLTADQPTVLIATVEKAEALMRNLGPLLLPRLNVLIMDEAHQVVQDQDTQGLRALIEHASRPMRLESFVSRLLAMKPQVVRVALTAVAGGAAEPVARWVEGREDAEPIGVGYRSTRQLIGVLEANPGQRPRVVLDLMNGRPLYVRGREDPVYLPLRVPVMPPLAAAVRNSLYHFNELHVLWTALHLRDGGRRILISVAQQVETVIKRFAEALRWDTWANATGFAVPDDPDLQERFRLARAACTDYCGADSFELTLLDHGIVTNHGQMPQRLRRLMTDLIDRRVCSIAVATATLTEGVNLPFDLIFLTSLKRRTFDREKNRLVVNPLPLSEFRNLAGRAGRPGAAEGMEGMTLIALPQRPSATAQGKLAEQRRQVNQLQEDYNRLRDQLARDERHAEAVASPLATLLALIRRMAALVLGVTEDDAFLDWLERTAPQAISEHVGTGQSDGRARLADSLDELDGFLLAAIEELGQQDGELSDGPRTEAFLADLWRRTFSCVAAAQEGWLSDALIHRGTAIPSRIYPDADQRRRLYQFGFAPQVGVRFEAAAGRLAEEIRAADEYGGSDAMAQLALFRRLGEIVALDPGFGFRIRPTEADRALLAQWPEVLGWWMKAPGAPRPEPVDLRNWQRFVAENLEFRLGVAVGAVVALAWSEGADDPLATPSLERWRETTGFPWFGFWARELLRWGTLDPFVAFALAQNLADSRDEAALLRTEFDRWLLHEQADAGFEDRIDPQYFLAWQTARPTRAATVPPSEVTAEVAGNVGQGGGRYPVLPIATRNSTIWIDAAGYRLAQSRIVPAFLTRYPFRSDFELVSGEAARVERVFTTRRSS